jgi:hypothetical protein
LPASDPPGAVVVVVVELDDDELHADSSAAAAKPIAASDAVRRPCRANVAFRVFIRVLSSVFVAFEERVRPPVGRIPSSCWTVSRPSERAVNSR